MALTPNDVQELQKQQNSLLNIDAAKYYFENLRPALMKFNTTYHTDRELNRTIVEVINHADSAAASKRVSQLAESYENLIAGITDPTYMKVGPMRYGTEEEKKAVQELISKFNDLSMILKYEKDPEPAEHEIRERLNYQPPNGGQQGYNLDDTSNRGPKPDKAKERIPNPNYPQQKHAY